MKFRNDLTVEEVSALLRYDPETGLFWWKEPGRGRDITQPAGHVCSKWGYLFLWVNRHRYRASRIAWLLMTGKWPENLIDHENLIRSDNRWINLREATHSQNRCNVGRRHRNASGFKGVSLKSKRQHHAKPWVAQIMSNKKARHLGYFATAEEAYAAYCEAAGRLHGEFARAA